MKKKLLKAVQLFQAFTGHNPEYVDTVKMPDFPEVALKVGDCLGIMYETVRDGKKERYIHEFRGKSRPLLISSHDGKQLFLLGGRYVFKEDGINDR